jgi:hypothetical protein
MARLPASTAFQVAENILKKIRSHDPVIRLKV